MKNMHTKTSHEFAQELLALPNLPIFLFDPSWIEDEESPNALTEPKAEYQPISEECRKPFICISSSVPVDEEEGGERANRILLELERMESMQKPIEEINAKLDAEDNGKFIENSAKLRNTNEQLHYQHRTY